MRNPSAIALAAAFLAGAIVALFVTTNIGPADPQAKHNELGLERFQEWTPNTFFVNTATWDEETRSLIVKANTSTDLPIVRGRVTVTVGTNVFTTTTDASGNYALEIYSESDDALVTITAEGLVGAERLEWHIYEGGIDGLQDIHATRASVWAPELFGRNVDWMMLAAATPR